jgi:hypothetical protein
VGYVIRELWAAATYPQVDLYRDSAKPAKLGIAYCDLDQDQHTPARLALLGDLRRALATADQPLPRRESGCPWISAPVYPR